MPILIVDIYLFIYYIRTKRTNAGMWNPGGVLFVFGRIRNMTTVRNCEGTCTMEVGKGKPRKCARYGSLNWCGRKLNRT